MTAIKFLIIHYNTPFLTHCLIRSIQKNVRNCYIYIFDNSDRDPIYTYLDDLAAEIDIIDNTRGQIIDFDEFLGEFPNRSSKEGGRCISARHCLSVDMCMDIIDDGFILLDSDVLITRDVTEIWNEKLIFVGEPQKQDYVDVVRLLPYFCYINVEMCKIHNIRYFNSSFMHGLNVNDPVGYLYDTGAFFYRGARHYPHRTICIDDYIVHYKGGSWDCLHPSNTKEHGSMLPQTWLQLHRRYWE